MSELNAEELSGTLTGFDEIAIEQSFGKPLEDLNATMALRALLFVVERRDGKKDAQAKKAVMEMPLNAVMERFDTEDEPVPDDPSTESGKDSDRPE